MESTTDMIKDKAEKLGLTGENKDEVSEHSEGPVARAIEYQTARIPSDVFLWGAVGSIGISAFLMLRGQRTVANFVGQWVPTLLLFGVYNKIVKVAGSDRLNQERPLFGKKSEGSILTQAVH